jgi:thiamine monophosphate kinase
MASGLQVRHAAVRRIVVALSDAQAIGGRPKGSLASALEVLHKMENGHAAELSSRPVLILPPSA